MSIFNVLVVGRKGIGKSTFIDIHTNDDGTYNDMSISSVDGEDYKVKYFEYELENSVDQYKNKDLILCCFAVNDVDSYNKLDSEYIDETVTHSTSTMLEFSHVTRHTLQARREAKGVPLLAVGTKCDLRDDPNRDDMVSVEQGVEMAIKIGATAYLEVSTTENLNLDQLQEEIVKIILHTKPKKTSNFSFGIVKFLLGR
ncbi:hypothetical protein ACHWQZ_G013163 [Mnemiopsis leidyi]